MWAKYDYSKFPIVKVTFNEKINGEEEFNEFLKEWVLLYDNKKDFTFIFDSSNISKFNISYAFKMRKFIKKIKEFPHQYLKKSLIIVSNKYVKYLLSIVFSVQKPIATVYIYDKKPDEELNFNNLMKNIEENINDDFKIIRP